jgi:SCP-2 sterol transfer family protein
VPEVVLADGESASGLATMMGTLLAQNVERSPRKFEDFRRVESRVFIDVADLGESITLSFTGDRCTVHNGRQGKPRVRIRTDSETLMLLSQIRIGALGLPNYFDDNGRAMLRAMSKGRLRIGGMHHVATLNRVTRLFSVA